jgi:NAD(P)-dependent dehydrogenase (short-subunit alcohol dehydrogenase family)
MFDLTGKVALVTGASSGIGYAAAIALAAQGAKVVVAARRMDRLEELVAKIGASGGSAVAVAMDVTQKADIDNAVAQTVAKFGKLDILVNNAGTLDYSPFLEMKEEAWDKVVDTNLKGYFLVAQAAAREMAKGKWGRIINIASIASGGVGIGYPMISHYVASKGGIVGLTEALAGELGPMGITVNAIGPGGVETEMTQSITEEQKKGMYTRLPIKRFGKPEEIAASVVYFASEEAAYTTGATLYVDGGWLAT